MDELDSKESSQFDPEGFSRPRVRCRHGSCCLRRVERIDPCRPMGIPRKWRAAMTEERTPRQLVEALAREQRHRWRHGERPLAEEYLQQYAPLQADAACACELI